jgi:hypothetical protein
VGLEISGVVVIGKGAFTINGFFNGPVFLRAGLGFNVGLGGGSLGKREFNMLLLLAKPLQASAYNDAVCTPIEHIVFGIGDVRKL